MGTNSQRCLRERRAFPLSPKGDSLHADYPYEEAANQIKQVIELNPTTYSSMCQSVRQGRPTEIEALNGAVVREAEKLDYPVPVNRTLAHLFRALQVRRSEQGVWGL